MEGNIQQPTRNIQLIRKRLQPGKVTTLNQDVTGKEALDSLCSLQGVTYEWINPEEHSQGVHAGVIAQNVEEVFPDWVVEINARGRDKELFPAGEKTKAVSLPHCFNAYIIESIKEL